MNVIAPLNLDSLESYLRGFPQVTIAHVIQAVNYCRNRICLQDKPDHFCDGCTLRTQHAGITFEEYLAELGEVLTEDRPGVLKGGDMAYLGSMDELHCDWEGEDGWKLAEDVYLRLRRIGVME